MWTTAPGQALKESTAGYLADGGPSQTGFAEKPCSVNPSEGGTKGNLSIYLPSISMSVFLPSKLTPLHFCIALSGPLANAPESRSCMAFCWSLEMGE